MVKMSVLPNLFYIQYNLNQNIRKLFSIYGKESDSKVNIEKENIQNSKHNIEGEAQNWKTDIIWLYLML